MRPVKDRLMKSAEGKENLDMSLCIYVIVEYFQMQWVFSSTESYSLNSAVTSDLPEI